MKKILSFIFTMSCLLLLSCGYDYKQDGIYAEINTSMGKMIVKLFYDKTPITVGNFIGLAEGTKEFTNQKTGAKEKKKYYDGLIFHRIIKGFMIQGGCPLGTGVGGPGYSFIDEFVPELKHDSAGVLSMANSGPNTNGSQFFITLAPAEHLDGRHTVWGRLVYGNDVLEEIGNLKTDRRDKPVEDVVIGSIKIRRIGKDAAAFDAEKAFNENEKILKQQAAGREKKLDEFLVKLKVNKSNIIETGTGLKYYVRKKGAGKTPKEGDTIVAHYSGYLTDGTKFDSSYDRGEPFKTAIGVRRVIAGWDEAFQQMGVGEKRVLIIPSELAYGPRGMPPVIPPGSALIFEVELLKIEKNKQ